MTCVICPTCGSQCSLGGVGETKYFIPPKDESERIADLERQLAERDAALARCVGASRNAIKFIRIHHWNDNAPGRGNWDLDAAGNTYEELKSASDSLPTSAQATAKVLAAARWIPCDEQMPDLTGRDDSHVPGGAPATLYSERVLVFNGTVRIDNLIQAEGSPETRTFYGSRKPVTHWMPLPEPPEAIREEQAYRSSETS